MTIQNPKLFIEYENADIAVVNKPANLSVYSTKKHEWEESVVSWFLKKYPTTQSVGDAERPGIVHRLDKQTSGLLILAKTPDGFEYLKNLFRGRKITKEYIALVYGELPKHGVIEKPLTKIGQAGRSKVRVDAHGKQAVTEYWSVGYYQRPFSNSPLARGEIDTYSLVRIKLHTGRTHQIRVHLAHIGHPVMGDNLYGKPKSQKLADLLPRQFLHASRLEFQLPDGTWLEVESELPADLKQTFSKLKMQSGK